MRRSRRTWVDHISAGALDQKLLPCGPSFRSDPAFAMLAERVMRLGFAIVCCLVLARVAWETELLRPSAPSGGAKCTRKQAEQLGKQAIPSSSGGALAAMIAKLRRR